MTPAASTTDRQSQILQAAMKVFEQNGYTSTTMDAVAAEAGVSKGSIYNYFKSKQTLFAAVVNHVIEQEEAKTLPVIEADMPAAEKFGKLLDSWAEAIQHLKGLGKVILESWAVGSREDPEGEILSQFRQAYARGQGWLADVVDQGIEEGDFAPDLNPALGAAIYQAVLDGLMVQHIYDVGVRITPELMAGWRNGFLAALRDRSPRPLPPAGGQAEES